MTQEDTLLLARLALAGHSFAESRAIMAGDTFAIDPFFKKEEAATALEEARDAGFRYISLADVPQAAALPDSEAALLPPGLFVHTSGIGTLEALSAASRHVLAVSGTRNVSVYGLDIVKMRLKNVTPLTTVITALTFGIAQRTITECLAAGIPLIVNMVTGPGECYPRALRELLNRVSTTKGCAIVTASFPHTDPMVEHFIRRNAVTAALAGEVFVAESKTRGGAMMTARLARRMGRDVTAAPGRLGDTACYGCLDLIAEGTARLWTPWTSPEPDAETPSTPEESD